MEIPLKKIYYEIMPLSYLTAGYLLSIFFFELSRKNQKYFFYNQGLTDLNLYFTATVFNIFLGGTLFTLIRIWKMTDCF